MKPVRDAEERRRRLAETEALLKPMACMTDEERARAAARWEREKAVATGAVIRSQEEARQDAERRLSELYHESRKPVAIGPELALKLAAMRHALPTPRI